MLGQTYRFTALNSCGATAAANSITIKPRRWKYGTDGAITDEASGAGDILGQTATLANGAYKTGVTQDNTGVGAKFIGGFFEITVTAPGAGTMTIFCERSVDGGTTWPDNGQGQWTKTFNFTASGTKRDTVEI